MGEFKQLMKQVRTDAKMFTSWPEEWIVKALQTSGKDIRTIREGLDRVIRGQEFAGGVADPAEEIAAALVGKSEADIYNALVDSNLDLREVHHLLGQLLEFEDESIQAS